jgi:hypothetical protein
MKARCFGPVLWEGQATGQNGDEQEKHGTRNMEVTARQ